MNLLLLKFSADIPDQGLKALSERLHGLIQTNCTAISEPLNCSTSAANIDDLADFLYQSYLKQGTPFVAVAYTPDQLEDDRILGLANGHGRVAMVHWSESSDEMVIITMHELGHIFGDIGHCHKKSCLMWPYYFGIELQGKELKELFCDDCWRAIKTGWVYKRLMSSGTEQGESTMEAISNPAKPPRTKEPFPDWSTYDAENPYDFIYRVLRSYGFGYERR